MGDVVDLAPLRRRIFRHRGDHGDRRGEIALFTGVRIERWSEEPSTGRLGETPDPRPHSPRRSGGC